jgi:hypothetical protein
MEMRTLEALQAAIKFEEDGRGQKTKGTSSKRQWRRFHGVGMKKPLKERAFSLKCEGLLLNRYIHPTVPILDGREDSEEAAFIFGFGLFG